MEVLFPSFPNSPITWPGIRKNLRENISFRIFWRKFRNAYNDMQGKLGKPQRGEGGEFNTNLNCIFHNFSKKQVYKIRNNYLCHFPYHIFIDRYEDPIRSQYDELRRNIERPSINDILNENEEGDDNLFNPLGYDNLQILYLNNNQNNDQEEMNSSGL